MGESADVRANGNWRTRAAVFLQNICVTRICMCAYIGVPCNDIPALLSVDYMPRINISRKRHRSNDESHRCSDSCSECVTFSS